MFAALVLTAVAVIADDNWIEDTQERQVSQIESGIFAEVRDTSLPGKNSAKTGHHTSRLLCLGCMQGMSEAVCVCTAKKKLRSMKNHQGGLPSLPTAPKLSKDAKELKEGLKELKDAGLARELRDVLHQLTGWPR